jgi:hypothetical protein
LVSPLATWFPGERDLARFRRQSLARAARMLRPRDHAWRAIAPGFVECVAMARSGLPFHVVAERRVDRSADPRRLPARLAAGHTVYLPQVHQVLPRLMRLMVALRTAFLGPDRDESSFLFVVDGTGRPGMGLHHDGEVDAFWLQLEGRRTVTIGQRVPAGTPEDLDDRLASGGRRAGWRTFDLGPGTLFHLPAHTPHAVVCRGRSLAATLTWEPARRRHGGRGGPGLLRWDVVSGFAEPIPPASATWLWTQVPTLAKHNDRDATGRLWTPEGAGPALAAGALTVATRLGVMPRLSRTLAHRAGLSSLIDAGILAERDLPRRIRPDAPAALDGWLFGVRP